MLGVHVSVQCVESSRRDFVSPPAKTLPRLSGFHHFIHRTLGARLRRSNILLIVAFAVGLAHARTELTVEELKARVSAANVGEKAKICLEIAEKQLNAADKQFTADDVEKAQTSLTDVVAFSELARDYSVQSHKHQKQTEIAIRSMTRKLNDLLHVVGREEQGPLKEAIKHLERVRDDLLSAMFPKGAK